MTDMLFLHHLFGRFSRSQVCMRMVPVQRHRPLLTGNPLYPDFNATQLSSLPVQQFFLYVKVFVQNTLLITLLG